MTEPTTETGRQLLKATSVGGPSPYGLDITAIEAEARLAALRSVYNPEDMPVTLATAYRDGRADALIEAAKRIRMLPKWDKRSVPGGFHVNRAAVLAILEDDES